MCSVKLLLTVLLSLSSFFGPLSEYCTELYERIMQAVPASAEVSRPQIVFEAATGTVISSSGEDEVFAAGHFAKLMTLLVAQESVERGDIAYDTVISVSAHANSMQGAQIWLDAGEGITVEELIKAITVGNANDACVALAEGVAKSEEAFTELMNEKARQLGMSDTFFADCSGISSDTVTTVRDIATLCAELSKHDRLYTYLTTWIDTVRGGKTQLVNLNRLVRSYNGVIGMKACYIENVGNCLAAAATRGDMTVIAVTVGAEDEDSRFDWARDAMNKAFASYEMYEPELTDGALQDISVYGGAKQFCKVVCAEESCLLIPKGSSDGIEISYDRVESVPAPIEKGTIIGSVSLTLGDEEIFSADLLAAESVDKLSYLEAFQRLLLELLKT